MEWIDGVRLTNRSALLQLGLEPSRLVDSLVQCTLRQACSHPRTRAPAAQHQTQSSAHGSAGCAQILRNGFFHADPHGGNLLVTADGQLAYIDFGMMSFVEPHQRCGLGHPRALGRGNSRVWIGGASLATASVTMVDRYAIIEAVVHMVNRDFYALAKLYKVRQADAIRDAPEIINHDDLGRMRV